MEHQLPPLPYPIDALEPHYSKETLEYHHGKHHKAYVDKLNELQKGTEFETMTLEDIIKKASGPIYNNAAQIWNHTFFWNSMKPNGGGEPSGALADAIHKKGGSFSAFRDAFIKALLPVDIWEHAYYIDYRNARQKFVETFLDKLVNWDGVSRNFG